MNKLVFLSFILVYANLVSSSGEKCHADEVECINTCCNSTDFYRVNSGKCQLIRKYFNLSLESKFNVFNVDHRYINLLVKFWYDVSAPCSRSKDKISGELSPHDNQTLPNQYVAAHIPDYCLDEQYNQTTHRYDLVPLNCSQEYRWFRYSRYVIIAGIILSILLLISTICIYLIIKELRNNMRLKIFNWYLGSLVLGHTSMISCVSIIWNYYNTMETLTLVVGFISSYFFMSTYLSMSVIGFEIWKTFTEMRSEYSMRYERRRYILYALYVWSVPILFYVLHFITRNSIWSFAPVLIIQLLNLVIYIILTYKICTTRHKVANLRKEQNFVKQTCKIILSLFFMMGMPRIIFFVSLNINHLAYYMIIKYIFFSLEAPLIFKLFVLKANVWNMLKSRFVRIYTQTQSQSNTTDVGSSTPIAL